jgi:hypothetical protein
MTRSLIASPASSACAGQQAVTNVAADAYLTQGRKTEKKRESDTPPNPAQYLIDDLELGACPAWPARLDTQMARRVKTFENNQEH